jgi:methyl-accepting chemotaxis protein
MLSQLSIGTRIGALVLGSLLTVGLLGGTVAVGAKRIFAAAAELEGFRVAADRIVGVERLAGRLRFQALRFVIERDAAAAGQFNKTAAGISDQLGELRKAADKMKMAENDFNTLSEGLSALRERFAAVLEEATALGLSDEQGLRNALRQSAKSVEDELKLWPGADKLLGRMESMRKMEKDFIIYNDEKLLAGQRKTFNEFVYFLADSGLDPATAEKLEALARQYRADLAAFVAATKSFHDKVSAFNEAFAALGPRFDHLLEAAGAGMTAAVAEQAQTRDEVVRNVTIIGALLLSAFFGSSLWVARSITSPLRRIEGAMERLAAGDEAAEVPGVARRDEIGAMARAVQVFKDNLHRTRQLENESRENERRAEENRKQALRAVAADFDIAFGKVLTTVGDAAAQIRNGGQALRDTAEKMRLQAADTSEKAGQTTEVVGIVNDVSRNLTLSIGDIGQRVNHAGQAVQRAVTHARDSDKALGALEDSSQRIGEIVQLINDIAGQTNLLALNATIEAARAGEAGKGFAVVAGEVKNLASQTAKATDDISGQVAAIQDASNRVVGIIRAIRGAIEEVDALSSEVSHSVASQLVATQKIADAVDRATGNSDEVMESVGVMAHTAAQTGKASVEMMFAAKRLTEELMQLEADADRFMQSVRV